MTSPVQLQLNQFNPSRGRSSPVCPFQKFLNFTLKWQNVFNYKNYFPPQSPPDWLSSNRNHSTVVCVRLANLSFKKKETGPKICPERQIVLLDSAWEIMLMTSYYIKRRRRKQNWISVIQHSPWVAAVQFWEKTHMILYGSSHVNVHKVIEIICISLAYLAWCHSLTAYTDLYA